MDTQPELLARHYAEAGLVEKSVAYWGKAGQRSAARSAMAEAVAQLHKGLDQLALLPDTPERQGRELEFWSALGAVLQAVKGQAAPETGHAYARARDLWEQLGSPSEFLHIPYGQSLHHVFRGELDLAQRLDEDLLRLSRQRNDSTGLVLGHISSGQTLLFAGGFASSRSHFEEALALYDPILCRSLARHAGPHPQVSALGIWGLTFSVSVIRTKPWYRAGQRSLRLGGWLTRRLWLRAWRSAPCCFCSAETTWPWISGQANWLRWRPSRVSPAGMRRERSVAGGSRSRMAMW